MHTKAWSNGMDPMELFTFIIANYPMMFLVKFTTVSLVITFPRRQNIL
jgi:hypothetical protein